MNERPFIILGGGGHARVLVSTLRQLNNRILAYTDPSPDTPPAEHVEYLGGDEELRRYSPEEVVLAVGVGSTQDTTLRTQLFSKEETEAFDFPPIVHPEAFVSREVDFGDGVQIMAGAVVQPGTQLGENVLVNTNASVDHDCEIKAHAHIAPGATLSGEVTLRRNVHVGTGASIIQGVNVGTRAVIGAGAVVVDDISSETTVVGVPARKK